MHFNYLNEFQKLQKIYSERKMTILNNKTIMVLFLKTIKLLECNNIWQPELKLWGLNLGLMEDIEQ